MGKKANKQAAQEELRSLWAAQLERVENGTPLTRQEIQDLLGQYRSVLERYPNVGRDIREDIQICIDELEQALGTAQ
jgi:hypothetical protein